MKDVFKEQEANEQLKKIEGDITHVGEKCLNKCDNYDEEYTWCDTGTGYTGWDYCSPKPGKFKRRNLSKEICHNKSLPQKFQPE